MFARSVFAAALAVGLTVSMGASAQTKILVNVFAGPAHFQNIAFKQWEQDVERVTAGRVDVEILPASAAPPPRQIDAALAGQYDAAFMFNGFNAQRADWPSMFLLPFALEGNAEAGSVAMWRTYQRYFADLQQFEDDGVVPLSFFMYPGGHYYSGTDRPIQALADIGSRKMWALVGTTSDTFTAAGIDHVAGPAARLAEFVQTNVVEGVAGISQNAIIAFGGKDFTKSVTFSDQKLQSANFIMFVTGDKWAEISPADQQAIRGVSGEIFARNSGRAADDAETVARQALIDAGKPYIEASPQFIRELREAGAPLFDAWADKARALGIDPDEPLEFFKEQTRALSG